MNNVDFNHKLSSIFTDGLFRFLVLILLFVALLYEERNLILISILLLTMFYTSKYWSHSSAKRIQYAYDAEKKKGFPGEWITLQASVSNHKFLPIWLKLTIPIDNHLSSSHLHAESKCIREEFSLLWYDRSSWQWKFTAQQRGVFKIGPPFLETGDLLGFFQQKKFLSQSVEMIVYPKPIALNSLFSPARELFGKPGLNSPVKDPVYPIATKDYYPEDPAKYIHWKASARHDRLQSKVFDSSAQRKVLFIIDVSSFPRTDKEGLFEKTLEVIAAMNMELDRQGTPYGILSNGRLAGNDVASLSIATGPEQLSGAMELLARLQLRTSDSMQKILFQENIIPEGSGCIYCAYRLNKKNIQNAELIKGQHKPVYFMIAKPSHHITCHQLPVFLMNEIHGGHLDSHEND